MKNPYVDITYQEFEANLNLLLREMTGEQLLAQVPDIYSEVREYFNNEVLERVLVEREEIKERRTAHDT